ncbi:DNA translocase FtsK [Patescibacteria group bacterium]|nr:DNA translocase FtsK [Patescibacteria group bacterium]MBU1682346.1 DNA translocase FtsK [Patescibacteria group bacterium]MBU1935403.1 DNA translocase FtsK [Patescibacteria group bacterium]
MARRVTSARHNRRLKKKDFKIELESHVAREVGAIIYLGLAAVFYLVISGRAGILGEWVNTYLRLIFGIGILALPVLFLALAVTLFVSRRIRLDTTRYLGIGLLLFSGLGLVHMRTPMDAMLDNVELHGGYVGFLASVLLRIFISDVATRVILIVVLIIAILITFEVSIRKLIALVIPDRQIKVGTKLPTVDRKARMLKKGEEELNIVKPLLNNKTEEEAQPFKINKSQPVKKEEAKMKVDEADYSDWEFPPFDLLSSASSEVYVSDKILKENAEKIKEKLMQFGIDVTMKDVNIGPTVLQYTLQPHEGIKLNKITALKNDLALALAAKSIRMEAPIPGKSLVGIEVPNEKRMIVHLREMIESEEFKSVDSKLRLVVGRDVSGAPVIDDLTFMPHLLIAGATGSGKSVGMNAFLISLLYQNSPRDLKFIMIDPKRVELTTYNGIPHLLTPVITDPEKAHTSLKWAVAEMNRRYKEFQEKKYRNIEEYNEGEEKKMYKIIIVIDELADLMMQATKKETEALICRIAQMARAVGIHLIIATQRPSVDVITGVIKANIPTRIAFTVTSGVDSRTIIDTVGAEDLLGMGDMLYLPGNMSRPIRVQGVYVSSKEIERVSNRVKLTIEPSYDESITEISSSGTGMVGSDGDGSDQDNLFDDAVQVIKDTGKASASLLQRRLSVGYARAARILDIMEEHGLIGPANGAKPREIYITDSDTD